MPKFEQQNINPVENPREAYEATEQDEAGLKAELADAKNADEIMAIATKLKGIEGTKNDLVDTSHEEAIKEEEERKAYDEAKTEDTQRTMYDEAKAEDAARTTAKETTKALDAELENLKNQITGKSPDEILAIAAKMKDIETKKTELQAEKDKQEYDKILEKIKGEKPTESPSELLKKYIYNGKPGYLEYKLESVPENIKADKEFMTEALKNTKDSLVVFSAASENLKNDKEFVLFAMSVDDTNSHSDMIYEKLSPELKNDKEVILAALKSHTSLDKIPQTFKDKETVLFAFRNDTSRRSAETIPSELMNDKEVALAALKNQQDVRGILSELPKNYSNDKDFVLEAIKNQPYNYLDASDELKNNPDVAFEAIRIDSERNRGYGGLVEKLPLDLKTNKEFMKKIDDLQQKLRVRK